MPTCDHFVDTPGLCLKQRKEIRFEWFTWPGSILVKRLADVEYITFRTSSSLEDCCSSAVVSSHIESSGICVIEGLNSVLLTDLPDEWMRTEVVEEELGQNRRLRLCKEAHDAS
ncbi:hypothetical protein Tco_0519535 [Tanacetum coccineum]